MAERNSFLARHWKLILNIVTIAALLSFAYAIRKDLWSTVRNLGHVNTWLLVLLIPIEFLNYHTQAKLYQGMFAVVGNKISYKFLFNASLELNFVNHVFPSGGAAGISYFGLRLKNDSITAAKATLIQVMKVMLGFVSYELLLIIGMFSLAIMGRANNLIIMVGTAISTLLLVGTFGFAYVVGEKSRIKNFFTVVTKGLNRVIQLVRPRHPETINISAARDMFEDFHDNYKQLQRSLPRLKVAFWYAFLSNATEVAAIYVVFLAFGHAINIGAVILAYGVANFAGLVSVLPGGVGIYEFLMAAVLASAGVSPGVSIPVIVMYRVVNTLIQVPPGYVLYQRNLSSSQKTQVQST